MKKFLLILALCLALPSSIATQPLRQLCLVKSVHDGDTLRCTDGTKVRFLLIDTPELSQPPFGKAAGDRLRQIALGKNVWLEFDIARTDRYGRTLAYAWTRPMGGVMLNQYMASAGLALVLSYPPNIRYIDQIRLSVDSARLARRGLWATAAFACSPKDHRQKRC